MKYKDISNQVFDRLTAIRPIGKDKFSNVTWLCKCVCGKEKVVTGNGLKTKAVRSCGCLRQEYLEKQRKVMAKLTYRHGASKTSEFKIWQNIKDRCINPRNHAFKRYGGRGITVCDRWLECFENFLEDMGERPSKNLSIDRINNDGNYEPNNCRWATIEEQNTNRHHNNQYTIHKKSG